MRRLVRARFEFERKWRWIERRVGGRGDCWIAGWIGCWDRCWKMPEFGGEWGHDVQFDGRVVGRGAGRCAGRAKRWGGMRGRRMLSGVRGGSWRDRPW